MGGNSLVPKLFLLACTKVINYCMCTWESLGTRLGGKVVQDIPEAVYYTAQECLTIEEISGTALAAHALTSL